MCGLKEQEVEGSTREESNRKLSRCVGRVLIGGPAVGWWAGGCVRFPFQEQPAETPKVCGGRAPDWTHTHTNLSAQTHSSLLVITSVMGPALTPVSWRDHTRSLQRLAACDGHLDRCLLEVSCAQGSGGRCERLAKKGVLLLVMASSERMREYCGLLLYVE